MGWKGVTVIDQRVRFIAAAELGRYTVFHSVILAF